MGMHWQRLLVGLLVVGAPLAAGAESPVLESQWYEGHSQVRLPDGHAVGGSDDLVLRQVDQAANLIRETVWSRDPRGTVSRYDVAMHVTPDGTFTMSEAGHAFRGAGYLVGPAWHWDAWHSLSLLPKGDFVDSLDRLTADGMVVDKRVCHADGTVTVTIHETLTPISQAAFEARRRAWSTP